mgnify:FL=1
MIDNGLEVVSCGANVPFADPEIFFGPIADFADEKVSIIPDFIANCGMARVFAYLMQSNVEITDDAIFRDVSETIHEALDQVRKDHKEKTGIAKASFTKALEKLM